MKEFVIDFLKVLSNCVLIICFAFSAFLLIINIYHYEEVNLKYDFNIGEDVRYKEYKQKLSKISKRMESVSSLDANYDLYGKVIRDYYNACNKKLNESSYNNLDKDTVVDVQKIYNLNKEILNNLNTTCLVSISSFIEESSEEVNFEYNPGDTIELVNAKRDLVQESAQNLMDSSLGNSAYYFSTDIFKGTIYDKNRSEFNMTVDNYTLIASILEDIADWYVLEFGGNI